MVFLMEVAVSCYAECMKSPALTSCEWMSHSVNAPWEMPNAQLLRPGKVFSAAKFSECPRPHHLEMQLNMSGCKI